MNQRDTHPLEFLRQVELFRLLDDVQLRQISALLHEKRFSPGSSIFIEQDPGDCLYIIMNGYVRVYLSSPEGMVATFRIYGSGSLVGEFAVLDGQPRSASATAISEVTAYILYRTDFLHLLQTNFEIVKQLLRILAERLRYTTRFAYSFVFLSATTRIAQALHEMVLHQAIHTSEGSLLKVTQSELAEQTGSTREWVNKALREFSEAGIVQTRRGAILIYDRERLRLWGDNESLS